MFQNVDRGKFKPPTDVIATDDRYIALAEIASMQADDIKRSLAKRKLVVTDTRQLPDHAGSYSYHQVEIGTGEFRLEYILPEPVDDTNVTADYQNGLLRIELPYLPVKPIEVSASKSRAAENLD